MRQRLITDNLLRRQLTPLGKVRCYVELMQDLARDERALRSGGGARGELREQLGKILRKSGRNVDRYLAVARLPMQIQQAFDSGQLSLVEAARAATLRPDVQDQIVAALEQGVPAREALSRYLTPKAGGHKKAADALAAFVRALSRAVTDLKGRVEEAGPPSPEHVPTLKEAQRLVAQLLNQGRPRRRTN